MITGILASGAGAVIAIFGDFRSGYRVVDRSGMPIQRLTELYSAAGLVGFKIHKRVTGNVMRIANKPLVLLTEHA
ncbi:MAG: phage major capsid protein [Dehalococcoidia bacterium]|nr:phage major capsid protein [Dehalococcoidia bacterium]